MNYIEDLICTYNTFLIFYIIMFVIALACNKEEKYFEHISKERKYDE